MKRLNLTVDTKPNQFDNSIYLILCREVILDGKSLVRPIFYSNTLYLIVRSKICPKRKAKREKRPHLNFFESIRCEVSFSQAPT